MAYIGKEPAKTGNRSNEDTFTATAGQTVFTSTVDVENESDLVVSINGVVQTNIAYTSTGTGGRTITFSSGMTVGDVVRLQHLGFHPTYVAVGDNSVTTAKVADNAVTGAKIAMGSDAAGDTLYYNGTDYVRLAKGTAGQVLKINSGATAPEWGADTAGAGLDTAQTFTKGQRGEITALTDGATITPDLNDSNNFSVTLGGNRTLANPSNCTAGQSGSIFITQDGTGSRTLAYGSYWDFAAGTAPTLTTTASAVDRIDYVVRTATSIHAVATLALS